MTIEQLKQLASYAAKGTAPADFSEKNVNEAFADALKDLAGSINKFNQNKYTIFEILIEAIEDVVPAKVIDAMGMFAEVKHVGQGQKAMFKTSLGKQRARQFLTQVALSGVYETFRLDQTIYEVAVQAIGGGISIDFERMLDGTDSLAEMLDIVAEGLEDMVYLEVQKALHAVEAEMITTNNMVSNTFNADSLAKLVMIVKAYGSNAVIFAPREFIMAMGADAIVPPIGSGQGIYHPDDIDAIHKRGLINLFRGTPIVEIPQSFINTDNENTWIDPQVAYVFPTGKERVVKVVFEGETQMWDVINRDQSIEIMVYKKVGVAIESTYNWAIYRNVSIDQTFLG